MPVASRQTAGCHWTNARPPAILNRFSDMMSSRTVNFFAVTWRFFALHVILFSSLLGALGQPYGLASRTPVGAFLNNAVPPAAPGGATGGWTTTPAFPGLAFDDPVFLTFEPRTNRLYVCERQGKIWHFA